MNAKSGQTMSRELRVASLPGPQRMMNPYLRLYYEAVQPHGVKYVRELTEADVWRDRLPKDVEIVHFHFPEYLWHGYNPRLLRALRRRMPPAWFPARMCENICGYYAVVRLRWFLKRLSRSGIVTVWTCHDVEHPYFRGTVDRYARQVLASNVDLVLVHCNFWAEEFKKRFPLATNICVMYHGNYDGAFPQPRSRERVLADLGLDQMRPVIATVGGLRSSKGISDIVEVARLLADRMQFVIAGRPNAKFDLGALQRQITQTTNVTLIARDLSDQEVADILTAADVALLPYREITTSGALLTALTLGRGVVVTDLPFFREILGENSAAGVLVPPADPQALARAIHEYLKVPAEERSRAARAIADRYPWSKVVLPVVETLRSLHRKACERRQPVGQCNSGSRQDARKTES